MANRRSKRKSAGSLHATTQIQGLGAWQKKLDRLVQSAQKQIAQDATRKGAEVLYRAVKENVYVAPHAYTVTLGNGTKITRHPGELKDAVMMTHLPESKMSSQYKIGFLRNRNIHYGIGYIAAFVEYGTSPHLIERKDGAKIQHGGAVAHPFFRPAIVANQDHAFRVMRRHVIDGLKKEWQK